MNEPLTLIYPDWELHSARLRDAVRTLTAEQLAISAGPEHGTIWQLAAHTAGARLYWLCAVFGVPGADRTPWPNPLTDEGWEDDPSHPRSGEELTWALDSTFDIVRGCLERWTVEDLAETTSRTRDDGLLQVHSRASVLNRLFSHDAFHTGEVSQLLGTRGLPGIEIWAKPWVPAGR